MPIINTSFFQTGANTSDATATASQILAPYTAYVASGKVTGTIQTRTQATPSISVSSGGLITATSTQQTGYVSGGTKTATRQLSTQGARTITPGTSNQTIPSGKYLTGTQTILGDSDLVASNIKSGVQIFGVTGTYSGQTGYETTIFFNSGVTVSSGTQLTIPGVQLKSLFGTLGFPASIPSLDNTKTFGEFAIVADIISPSSGFQDGIYGYVTKSAGTTPGGSSGFSTVSLSISGGNTLITITGDLSVFPGFTYMT